MIVAEIIDLQVNIIDQIPHQKRTAIHWRCGFTFKGANFMDNVELAREIKERLKMPQMLEFYGFEIKRGNRIACPFHNGTDSNCGVKDDYIHCFVCDESADQIKFVEKYFDLTFWESVQKLNSDFALGLPIGGNISQRQKMEFAKRAFEAKKKREEKEMKKSLLKHRRDKALDEWIRLDKQRREYQPKNENEPLNPLFIEAIMELPHADYILDCAELELYEYEHATNS